MQAQRCGAFRKLPQAVGSSVTPEGVLSKAVPYFRTNEVRERDVHACTMLGPYHLVVCCEDCQTSSAPQQLIHAYMHVALFPCRKVPREFGHTCADHPRKVRLLAAVLQLCGLGARVPLFEPGLCQSLTQFLLLLRARQAYARVKRLLWAD